MRHIALGIIETAFAGKKDKAGAPYINHLKRVAEQSKHYCAEPSIHEELEIIGLLHDLLEDCPEWTSNHLMAIFKSVTIVDAVNRLTKKPDQDYDKYISDIANNRFARAVKLADLADNMDLTRLRELSEKDIERLKRYHKSYVYLSGDIGWASASLNQMERKCDNCGTTYTADIRNIKRGWGLTCSKSCAASKREKSKVGYNPERVKRNNIRRELWNMKFSDENEYGVFKGRYSSEGYKLYQNGDEDTAVDKFGNAVYTINNWEHEHPFSDDAF